jgi:hypothetical protein
VVRTARAGVVYNCAGRQSVGALVARGLSVPSLLLPLEQQTRAATEEYSGKCRQVLYDLIMFPDLQEYEPLHLNASFHERSRS